jgi:hypothetical protein
MTTDELLAAQKVRDLNREAAALYQARLLKERRPEDRPHNPPPIDPPIPMNLAKEFRQTL